MALVSHRVISDVFNLENVVQQTCMVASKNILIDTLRDIFRRDREYRYVDDVFGFPKTPSNLGLDPTAGLDDEETTRIFIGSSYRYDVKFNPSIIVKNTGNRYKPISFNQDWMGTTHRKELITDGYGNKTIIVVPAAQTLVGSWDQTFEVKIVAESEMDREEIADIVMVSLIGSRRKELEQAGLFIKSLSSGGESEQPYANDYLYTVSISLEIRSEWKILIPISNVIERIVLCVDFNVLDTDPPADALAINEQITLADQLP
jgi:hypothetical protein